MGKTNPTKPKGDKTKQFGVITSIVHDDREGITRVIEKPKRYAFATEDEAVAFAHKFEESQ